MLPRFVCFGPNHTNLRLHRTENRLPRRLLAPNPHSLLWDSVLPFHMLMSWGCDFLDIHTAASNVDISSEWSITLFIALQLRIHRSSLKCLDGKQSFARRMSQADNVKFYWRVWDVNVSTVTEICHTAICNTPQNSVDGAFTGGPHQANERYTHR